MYSGIFYYYCKVVNFCKLYLHNKMGVCLIFKFLVQEGHYLTAVNSYNSTPSSYIYLYSLVIRGQNLHVNYTIILNLMTIFEGDGSKGSGMTRVNCY
jgi:hypothetical protein